MIELDSQEIVPTSASMSADYEAPQFEVLGQLTDLAVGQGEDGNLTMVFSIPG